MFCEFLNDCDKEEHHKLRIITLVGDVGVKEPDSCIGREDPEKHCADVAEGQGKEIDFLFLEVIIELLVYFQQQLLHLRICLSESIEALGVVASDRFNHLAYTPVEIGFNCFQGAFLKCLYSMFKCNFFLIIGQILS